MSLSALFLSSPTCLLMPTLSASSKEILDEHDPLFLCSDESVAACLVLLLHLCQFLLMGIECLAQLLQRLSSPHFSELLQFVIGKPFRIEDQANIGRFWRWYLLQGHLAGFCPDLVSIRDACFQWGHWYLRRDRQCGRSFL